MKLFDKTALIISVATMTCFCTDKEGVKNAPVYEVFKLNQPLKIDADWYKQQWKKAKTIDIVNYMGDLPAFRPEVKAKMMYDDKNIYVIFRVKDRYVRCLEQNVNGKVWEDSAVEFFFSPDTCLPLQYFNLEINCGGTPLMYYNTVPRQHYKELEVKDISMIEIAHSLPQKIDPEIAGPVTWTLEFRIPFNLLRMYSNITQPEAGITWKANFYKIAENTSNPHYITWSAIDNDIPDFHLPQFFGRLEFR